MSKKDVAENEVEPVVEVVAEPIVEAEGKVNCKKLYLRSEADVESKALRILSGGTRVRVYPATSTDEFYHVCTANGLEGFCMKKFITLV
jgi:hypothetical protein